MVKIIGMVLAFSCFVTLTGCSSTDAQMSVLVNNQQLKLQSMGYTDVVFSGRDVWFAPVIDVMDRVDGFTVTAGNCQLDVYVNDGMGSFTWVDVDNGIRQPLYDPTVARLQNYFQFDHCFKEEGK